MKQFQRMGLGILLLFLAFSIFFTSQASSTDLSSIKLESPQAILNLGKIQESFTSLQKSNAVQNLIINDPANEFRANGGFVGPDWTTLRLQHYYNGIEVIGSEV